MAPIHVAAATSNLGHLRAALDVGGQLVDSLNSDGATPLMYGAFAASAEVVTELLQRGADVRAVDQAGSTPLHYCANKGSADVARLLLQAGADPCAKDNGGRTPYDVASRKGGQPTGLLMLLRPLGDDTPGAALERRRLAALAAQRAAADGGSQSTGRSVAAPAMPHLSLIVTSARRGAAADTGDAPLPSDAPLTPAVTDPGQSTSLVSQPSQRTPGVPLMPPSSIDPAQVIAAQRTELARLRAALEEALQRAAAAEAEESDSLNEARRQAGRMHAAMAEMAAEMQQLRLDLAASRAAEAAREAEEQAVLAARTSDVAAAAVTAAADGAVVQRLVDDAAGEVVDARVAVLQRDVRVASDSVASLAGPVYAAVFSLATSQRHYAHVSDASSLTERGSAAGDATTGVADSAQAAMATADSAMRQLDATRAAVRRALSTARTAVPSDAAAASGDEVAAAARARDTAEQAAATALGSAADACARLASWRRSAETEAHRARAAAAAAGAMADALEAHLRMDGNGDASEVPDTMATLRDVALHVLPASQAAAVAVATAVAALNTEAEALERVSPKLVSALRSMATSAHANGDNALSADMSAGAGAAAAAEALAAEHTSALRSLRRVAAARAAAVAAVNGLPAAEETRLKALQSLLDLSHERSTAQLKREWTADREARYSALVVKHATAVEAAEAAAENAAAALTSPAVVEAYPELAARLRDVAANAALVGLQPHSDATSAPSSVVSFATAAGDGDESFVSAAAASTTAASESVTSHRDDWEQVDVLQRTPRCAVLRVRPRSRPGAPHRVLKVFPHADSSFLAEARHLAAARHPLVCELEAAYVEGGMAHLVLPFYGGGSTRPWFERLKTAKGGFDAEQWTAVRRTFRQLLQALAFCHGRGIAHRDVKPENVLWRGEDQSQLVLCDFGLSRDLSRRLETTRHVGAAGGMGGGTPLYLAPEALAAITDGAADDSSHDGSSSSASDKAGGAAQRQVRNWKDCPWAVDCFSVGICMLELACGEFISWHPPTRRLQPVAPPHGRSLPLPPGDRGGHSMGSFLALALALTQEQPDDRPSADEALLHPFFAEFGDGGPPSQQPDAAEQLPAAAATGSLPPAPPPTRTLRSPTNGAKLAFVAALLGETRVATRATSRGSPGSSCFTVALSPATSSDAALLNDVINAVGTASPAALSAPVWAAAIGAARVPVSDLLRRTFTAAASPSVGLLHAATPGGPHMPAPGAAVPACRALGRLLWRGVVEGVPCGLELAPLVYAALLGRQTVALGDATSALAHWAVFDPAAASRARHAVALSSQGAAQDACAAAVAALWTPREEAFTALAAGFRDASDVAHSGGVASLRAAMELLDEWELGALFCGGAYVNGRDVAAALTWHGASWPLDDPHRAWMAACLAAMPEPSLRLFLARTTGRLALDPPSSGEGDVSIWVTRMPPSTDATSAVPQFPGNGVLALPHTCPDAATFQTRLFTALGVPQQQSTAAEETTAISTPPPLKCASCDAPVASTEATADLPPSAVLCPSCDPSNPAAAASACCVCLAAKRSTLLLPCRHLCMCNACATHVVERASARCPLCRVFIQARVMDIYL